MIKNVCCKLRFPLRPTKAVLTRIPRESKGQPFSVLHPIPSLLHLGEILVTLNQDAVYLRRRKLTVMLQALVGLMSHDERCLFLFLLPGEHTEACPTRKRPVEELADKMRLMVWEGVGNETKPNKILSEANYTMPVSRGLTFDIAADFLLKDIQVSGFSGAKARALWWCLLWGRELGFHPEHSAHCTVTGLS